MPWSRMMSGSRSSSGGLDHRFGHRGGRSWPPPVALTPAYVMFEAIQDVTTGHGSATVRE